MKRSWSELVVGVNTVGCPNSVRRATFHIDHIVPRAAGGPTSAANLCLGVRFVFVAEIGEADGHRP